MRSTIPLAADRVAQVRSATLLRAVPSSPHPESPRVLRLLVRVASRFLEP
jgi:hypothetical protein